MNKITITIDGYASSGKSSTALAVAKQLGYKYINSGLIYRAISLFLLENNISLNDHKKIIQELNKIRIKLIYNVDSGVSQLLMNDEDVISRLNSFEVESCVAKVSTYPEVRERVVNIQQNLGKGGGVVVEGRDTGTEVFPKAELKIFMIADVEARAQRRHKELEAKKYIVDFEELKSKLYERDLMDKSRSNSPLLKAGDAIEIDTTHIKFNDQVERIIFLAKKIINSK